MLTEEQMTVNERRKYLQLMKPPYQQAKRVERSRLLTEMQKVTGLHRKSLLHASSLARKKPTTPRQRTYGLATEQVILLVWESLDILYVNAPVSLVIFPKLPPILPEGVVSRCSCIHEDAWPRR